MAKIPATIAMPLAMKLATSFAEASHDVPAAAMLTGAAASVAREKCCGALIYGRSASDAGVLTISMTRAIVSNPALTIASKPR